MALRSRVFREVLHIPRFRFARPAHSDVDISPTLWLTLDIRPSRHENGTIGMCGVAGVLRQPGQTPDPALLQRMISAIAYRGPDERGVYCDDEVGLAHARLSIIDVADGQQPMKSPESGITVVFNGEIFNYLELRAQLVARGHRFRTRSDTEVVLRMYEEYGEACVEAFNGQWAICIWDPRRRQLFLSRDRLGVRPLFYARAGGDFLFASEIKALLQHPGLVPEVDLDALDEVFTFWATLPPRTFFRGISELAPGHNLRVTAEGVSETTYWQLDYHESAPDQDEKLLTEELASLLTDAVRIRLRSDVPVGAYLSGGLDSSLTAALIRRHSDTLLETFSVTFEDREFDESNYQRAVAEHIGTRHASVDCTDEDICRVFPDIIRHTEKPIIRTAPAPLYLLSKLVHDKGYRVVLTGEGADEIFGGYDIFKESKLRRFWSAQPDSSCRPLLLRRLYPYLPALQAQPTPYLKAFFHVDGDTATSPFFSHLPRWDLTTRLKGFFSPEVKEALRGRDALDVLRSRLPERFGKWHPFCQAQYLETAVLLPGYILSSQGDRMAMANSVEGRYPFLDCRVVEFASRLHPSLKMRVLNEKHLLKQVAMPLIPAQVANRTKQPYRAPDVPSFFAGGAPRAQYVRELLSPESVASAGLFDSRAVGSLAKKCERQGSLGIKDSMALVGLLSTQLLVDQFTKKH